VPAGCSANDQDGQKRLGESAEEHIRRSMHEHSAARGGGVSFSFEDADEGSAPRGFEVVETAGAGKPATWRVERDGEAPHGGKILRLAETRNAGGTFNLLLSEKTHGPDLAMTVRVRADRGEEDRGGGIVWRAQDGDHYYCARWNPLEDNLRAYVVERGVRKVIGSVNLRVDPDAWHVLGVKTVGSRIQVSFDGVDYLAIDDGTFSERGKIGFWTKADAATSFDDLTVAAGTSPGQG
jgi:hypothetical protein